MLTRVEIQVLNYVYGAMSSNFTLLPVFWKNGRAFERRHSAWRQICNSLIYCLLLAQFILRLIQLSGLISKHNINVSVLEALFVVRDINHLILRFNIWHYKTELVRLINQSLAINFNWGNLR